jgi:hypothetical protein
MHAVQAAARDMYGAVHWVAILEAGSTILPLHAIAPAYTALHPKIPSCTKVPSTAGPRLHHFAW